MSTSMHITRVGLRGWVPEWSLGRQRGDKTKGEKTSQSSAKTLTFWLPFHVDSYLIYIVLSGLSFLWIISVCVERKPLDTGFFSIASQYNSNEGNVAFKARFARTEMYLVEYRIWFKDSVPAQYVYTYVKVTRPKAKMLSLAHVEVLPCPELHLFLIEI